ncbi:MAG: hypothetical protein JNJ89_19375 [Rubrivivax sp.]|nr:hypothetical protein [Rubrivivax sp.]
MPPSDLSSRARRLLPRRDALRRLAAAGLAMTTGIDPAGADASGRALGSYYARHITLAGGQAFVWEGSEAPRAAWRTLADLVQAGASQRAWYLLRAQGDLLRSADAGEAAPRLLMRGAVSFAAGQSGWFALDAAAALWYGATPGGAADAAPVRLAAEVATACIGDSADYYITHAGELFVKGLAHRGQYGDGKLTATPHFVATAGNAVAVRAHTGHALHLKRDGSVHGTGGNRYGPLSSHGLGDKADRWGPIFEGAVAIATGSRHSLAVRADGSLWAWGEGFEIPPRKIFDGVAEVAAGDTATLALTRSGELWQWERGGAPRRLRAG